MSYLLSQPLLTTTMTRWLLVVDSWKSHHKCPASGASHPSLTLTQVAHSLQWLSHHRDGWRSQLLINSTQWRHAGIESQSLDDSIKSEPDRPLLGLRTRRVGADLVPRQCRNHSPRESGRIIYIFIIVCKRLGRNVGVPDGSAEPCRDGGPQNPCQTVTVGTAPPARFCCQPSLIPASRLVPFWLH